MEITPKYAQKPKKNAQNEKKIEKNLFVLEKKHIFATLFAVKGVFWRVATPASRVELSQNGSNIQVPIKGGGKIKTNYRNEQARYENCSNLFRQRSQRWSSAIAGNGVEERSCEIIY